MYRLLGDAGRPGIEVCIRGSHGMCGYVINGGALVFVVVSMLLVAWLIATSRTGPDRHRTRFGRKLEKVDLDEARRRRSLPWWRRRLPPGDHDR